MKYFRKTGIRIVVCAFLAAAVIFPVTVVSEQSKSDTEEIIINTESAVIDMEAEEFTIPSGAEIIVGDLTVKGERLDYSNKTRIAVLTGSPVTASYVTGIETSAKKVTVDIDRQLVIAEGGCRLAQADKVFEASLDSEKIEFNYEKKWAQSRSGVKIHYKNLEKKPEQKEKAAAQPPADSAGAAKEEKKNYLPDIREIYMTAGAVFYKIEAGELEASGTVRFEFDEGDITAGEMNGNLKDERFTLSRNVDGRIRDVSFHADRIDLDNAKQEAVISGNIVAHRVDGAHFTANKITVSYKEGAKRINVDGRVIMKLPRNMKKTSDGAAGPEGPGGGSP